MMHALDPAKANENTTICDDCLFFELVLSSPLAFAVVNLARVYGA